MRTCLTSLAARSLALAAAALPLTGGAALAENLYVQMEGAGRFEYDSNPLLLPSGEQSSLAMIASPGLNLKNVSANSTVELDTRFDFSKYDLHNLSSNDNFTRLRAETKGETWLASVTGGFDYDTTRTSELTTSGTNLAGVRHTGYSLAPHFEKNLSQVDALTLDGGFSASNYDDKSLYNDFMMYSVAPGYKRAFDPRNTGVVSVEASHFTTTTGSDVDIDNIIPAVGWEYMITPQLQAKAKVGVQYTEWNYGAGISAPDKDGWDYYYSAALTYKGIQDVLSFKADRRPVPLSNGAQAQASTFNLSETHTVNPTLDLKLDLFYQISKESSYPTGDKVNYFSAMPQAVYHATENVDLNLAYRYREQENKIGSTDASSNAILLYIVYKPDVRQFIW